MSGFSDGPANGGSGQMLQQQAPPAAAQPAAGGTGSDFTTIPASMIGKLIGDTDKD